MDQVIGKEPMEFATTIGVLGFIFYLGAYFFLQMGVLDGNGVSFTLLNLTAAGCVLISLTSHFNLASALIQISWIILSLVGIARTYFARNSSRKRVRRRRYVYRTPGRRWARG